MSEKTSKGTSVNGAPIKSNDFVGRGGATERADFGTFCPEEAERSPRRRVPKSPKSEFRHKSRQEQAAESKLRMEKRGEKLEKAKEKLAK